MEAQYYTPTIDEFHVGFEFEMDAGTGWSKQTFPKPWWESGGMGGMSTLKRCLQDKNIRVKHLCRQDIEDLLTKMGFEVEDDINSNGGFKQEFRDNLEIKVEANKTDTPMVFIFKSDGLYHIEIDETRKVFELDIRNKSELRKIMQQCGISA